MERSDNIITLESADAQLTMLRALLGAARADEEGMVMVQRDHFMEALDRIDRDHRRQLEAMPLIAERLVACFGITS